MLQQQYQSYPYGSQYMGMGVGYNQQQPSPVMNNFLSPEQISEMQHGANQFQTRLSRDEYMRAICTHKSNNNILLSKQSDGQRHCAICGKSFVLFDTNTPDETVYTVCKNMHDLIQSIKTYMLDAPEDLKNIYMILGFIEKAPMLWKSAVKSFQQASDRIGLNIQNNGQPNTFQMLGQIFGGSPMPNMMGGYYGQQPYQQAPVNGYGMAPPVAPPPVAPNQGVTPGNDQNGYGYNPSYVMNQPQQAPMAYGQPSQQNPIGYVEPNQQNGVAQTQINISPTAPNQSVPLSQDTVNPNLQTPEKVDVNKSFTPSV